MSKPTDTSAEACERVRHYIAMRSAQPLRQIGDDIHGIRSGTPWEAVLTLTDLRALVAERDALRAAIMGIVTAQGRLHAAQDDVGMASGALTEAIYNAVRAARSAP